MSLTKHRTLPLWTLKHEAVIMIHPSDHIAAMDLLSINLLERSKETSASFPTIASLEGVGTIVSVGKYIVLTSQIHDVPLRLSLIHI